MFFLRPNTSDAWMYRDVVERNEYGLPERFRPENIIIDVGAHIGSFVYAALNRGAGCVVGYEPNPENLAIANQNLSTVDGAMGRYLLVNAAVWRSDLRSELLEYRDHSGNYLNGEVHTGVGNVLGLGPGAQSQVRSVSLDTIIEHFGQIRLLKLDCEGSEFPIIFSSSLLSGSAQFF